MMWNVVFNSKVIEHDPLRLREVNAEAKDFQDLCEMVRRNGVQPLLTKKKGDKYLLVDGYHRFAAAKAVGSTPSNSGGRPEDGVSLALPGPSPR